MSQSDDGFALLRQNVVRVAACVFMTLSAVAAAQTPYQPRDPVVTVVPGRTLGVPIQQISDPDQQRVYKQLLNNFTLLGFRDEGSKAQDLFDAMLSQLGVRAPNTRQPSAMRTTPSEMAELFGDCRVKPTALLIHIAVWHVEPFSLTDGKTPRDFVLTHSEWHGYQWQPEVANVGGKCVLKPSERSDGSPSFLGAKCIYFLGINAFDAQFYGSRVSVDYKFSQLPQLPANLIDLSTALSAVTGVQLTTPTNTNGLPSAPTPIDTGANGYQGTSLSTIIVNLSQSIFPASPLSPRSLMPTSAAPYLINASFFLQFQPSPLQVSQGTKYGPPATGSQTGSTAQQNSAGGNNDTSIYLNDHLEQLLAQKLPPTIGAPDNPQAGRPSPLTLGPLPPGLTFETDAELAYDQVSSRFPKQIQGPLAGMRLPAPTVPAQSHLDTLEAVAATQKFEAVALVAAIEASQAVQTLKALNALTEIQPREPRNGRSSADSCCATADDTSAASRQSRAQNVRDAIGSADVPFDKSPLLQDYLENLRSQAKEAANSAISDLEEEQKKANEAVKDAQTAVQQAQNQELASNKALAEAQQAVTLSQGQSQKDVLQLSDATNASSSDKNQLCSVDYQLDVLEPPAVRAQADNCPPAPSLPSSVAAPPPPPSAPPQPGAAASQPAATGYGAPPPAGQPASGAPGAAQPPAASGAQTAGATSEPQYAPPAIQAAAVAAAQAQQAQIDQLEQQRQELIQSYAADQQRITQLAAQKAIDAQKESTAESNAASTKTTHDQAVRNLAVARSNADPVQSAASALSQSSQQLKIAQGQALSTDSTHLLAQQFARCALVELRLARRLTAKGSQTSATTTRDIGELSKCQVEYASAQTHYVLASSQPEVESTSHQLSISSPVCKRVSGQLTLGAAPLLQPSKQINMSYLFNAIHADINAAYEQAACYLRDIDSQVFLLNQETLDSQTVETVSASADATKSTQPAPASCTSNCCCCCQPNGNAAPPAAPGAPPLAAAAAPAASSDPAPVGGVIRGISFRAGDFPLLLTLHSPQLPYIPPIPALGTAITISRPEDQINSCVLPTEVDFQPSDMPCVEFVALTSTANSSPSPSGGSGGGGKGGGGGGGNGAGGGNGGPGGGQGTSAALSPAQPVDCSRQSSVTGPCNYARSFTVDDPEWWDISLGLSVPGVKENTYTVAPLSSAGKTTGNCLNSNYTCAAKHHADAYVFVDLYPLATNWWRGRSARALIHNDNPFIPHLNFGIPLTSQSLYRPFFGAAWNVFSPLQHRGFPLSLSAFAGIVDMKQTVCGPACVTALTASAAAVVAPGHDRALRGAFGVEVSIGGIAGKLKGASSGGAAGKSSSSH